jgi:tRNA(Ile)-lysidine synthase
VSAADRATPVSSAEAAALFNSLRDAKGLILAVSGGPDSTALLLLAARWRRAQARGPALLAVTVDHGLRPEARAEAEAVKRVAKQCGVAHRTMRWTGRKPKSGLQQAAREARYRLLAEAAKKIGARHVLTGHTRDDQAETVLMRLLRGSGLEGLVGMRPLAPMLGHGDLLVVRPFLDVPKVRLVATLRHAKIPYAEDPSNSDPRFTRTRLRGVMLALAVEGLTTDRLVRLSDRALRAEGTILEALAEARDKLAPAPWPPGGPVTFEAHAYYHLPEEIALRLLGIAIEWAGDEGPVELGKLEAMYQALYGPLLAVTHDTGYPVPFRRTLAGALVTLKRGRLTVERAPARRGAKAVRARRDTLNHGATLPPQVGQTALK